MTAPTRGRFSFRAIVHESLALSLAGAIFLIEELYDPLGGVITISSAPMQKALDVLGQ